MVKNIYPIDKQSLRRLVTQLKSQLSATEKQCEADAIFSQIEQNKWFSQSRNFAAYWALPDEMPTQQFIEKWYKQKNVYLPIVEGDTLIFRRYEGFEKMKNGEFGIQEPTGEILNNLNLLDFVIVPGVAFDLQNNRMGRGRGFYDRILSQTTAKKIGVAFKCQIFNTIPICNTDIKMDFVFRS